MEKPLYFVLINFPIMIIGGVWKRSVGGDIYSLRCKKVVAIHKYTHCGRVWAIWHLPLWFVVGSNQMSMNFYGLLLLLWPYHFNDRYIFIHEKYFSMYYFSCIN